MIAAVAYETGYGTIRGAEHHPAQSVFAWLLMLPNLLTGPNVPNVTWTLSYEMVFYLLLVALFSWGVHRRSGSYATIFAVGAVALGGVLPMAALTDWAGHADHGGLALNATADALVLAGILLAVSSRSLVARAGAAVAGLTALVLVMVNQGSPSPWEGCVILALMFTGTLIYRTQQRQPGTSRAMTAAIVVGVLALTTFAGLWHGQQRHLSHQWLIQWATSVLLAGVTFGLGLAASHRRVPRWCAWLGMISFSVYLLHPLVFDAYRDVPALHRPHTLPVQWLMFAGCAAVIIGLSSVTYYLIERPMQRVGRRLSGRGGGSGSGETTAVAGRPPGRAGGPAGRLRDRRGDRLGRRRDRGRVRAGHRLRPARGADGRAERVEQQRGGGRVRRLAVADRDHRPAGAAQPGRAHARVAGRAQRQAGQQGDAEASRDEGLGRDEVVGRERDPGREPGLRALPEQVLAAPVAAGDPALIGQPGQVGGPQLGHRGRQRRLAAADRRVRHDQVHRLGQQHQLAEVVPAGDRGRGRWGVGTPHASKGRVVRHLVWLRIKHGLDRRPQGGWGVGAPHASGRGGWGVGIPHASRQRGPAGAASSASCRKISATSTYPARSIRSASGGSASVSRRSKPGCRSCRIAAAVGTMVPRADGNAASRSRPARSPAKTTSSFSAASRRPMTSTARSASSRPASVSRMPRPARWTSLVPVSASSRAR